MNVLYITISQLLWVFQYQKTEIYLAAFELCNYLEESYDIFKFTTLGRVTNFKSKKLNLSAVNKQRHAETVENLRDFKTKNNAKSYENFV